MSKERKEKILGIIKRAVISLFVIGLFLLALFFLLKSLGLTSLDQQAVQEKIKILGAWGTLGFILLSFLQVTLVPIPAVVTILAGSYLFGVWKSFLLSYIGMFLGSLFAFKLGRVLGRPFVNWVLGDKTIADKYLSRAKGKEVVVLFFMFLLPFFPDDALCSVAGITSIKWRTFIIIQLVTRATSIIGTLFFMSGQIIPFHGWGLIVLGAFSIVCIVAFIYSFKNAEKISLFFNNIFDKIVGVFNKKSHNNGNGGKDE